MRRAERYAAVILGIFVPVLGVIALALGGLLLAAKDDSTLGLMRALVFRCKTPRGVFAEATHGSILGVAGPGSGLVQ